MTQIKNNIFTKKIVGWFFYDWAISVFYTVITTFVFATYFTEKVANSVIEGTKQWGNAISLAAIIIVIISPIFGAIADFEGRRKPWLALFTSLIVVGNIILWFVQPSSAYVNTALTGVVIGLVGAEVAMVFYNAMLDELAPRNYIGRMSGWAWGFGYFGGLIGLIICLFGFIKNPALSHLSTQAENIRIVGPFVALWSLLFSLPLFFLTPDREKLNTTLLEAIKHGSTALIQTLKSVKSYKNIFKFLIARMIYTDGLNTLFVFGGIYAAGTFYFNMQQVIIFGITLHIAAGLGAISFAWLDDLIGPKKTILFAIVIMLAAGTAMVVTKSLITFWSFGLLLSIGVGPLQAASRSFMIQVSPKKMLTELFGLYALSGRITSFAGPWLLGQATYHFNSQRAGVSTILFFILIGGFLLLFVEQPRLSAESKN